MTGFEQYIAYLRNELSAAARHALEQKLVTSEQARLDLEAAKNILAAGTQPAVAPRSSLVASVQAAFRRHKQRVHDSLSESAELAFDSWSMMPAEVRSKGMDGVDSTLPERQMLFSSGNLDLDIQLARDDDAPTRTMHGQLLGVADDALAGIELQLVPEKGSSRRVLTDEFGRFRFSHLPSGQYGLQVNLEERTIQLDIEA